MEAGSSQRFYSRQFWTLSVSHLLFFASFNMIIPELPNYLTSLGGEDYKGFIIFMFTLAAGISRPFSGRLADSVGRVPVMLFGISATMLCGLLYPWFATLSLFFLLRFLHGFSTGFAPTGATAYVGDIAPAHRRAEAIGLVSLFGTIGMTLGPVLGSEIAKTVSLEIMFYVSSAFGLAALIITLPLRETVLKRQKFSFSHLKITRDDFYEPRVLRPAVVLMLGSVSFGAMITLTPDFSEYLGLENKGWYLAVLTLSSMVTRFFSGRLSDRIGRIKALRIGLFLLAAATILLGLAQNHVIFFISAAVFGIATGINSPTVMAWTIDLGHDHLRGRALATVFIALEIGIGGGALLGGWIYGNNPANFIWTFFACSALCLVAFGLLFREMKTQVIDNQQITADS